jgi:hypothetical protein
MIWLFGYAAFCPSWPVIVLLLHWQDMLWAWLRGQIVHGDLVGLEFILFALVLLIMGFCIVNMPWAWWTVQIVDDDEAGVGSYLICFEGGVSHLVASQSSNC